MIPMTLSEAASAIGAPCPVLGAEVVVRRVTTDSREVRPGDLFVALKGQRFDGNHFVREAAMRGAAACLVSHEHSMGSTGAQSHATGDRPGGNVILPVSDTMEALASLARHYRRRILPAETVVVAVTGSNGKTTTKCMIDQVLRGSRKGLASPRSFNNQIGVPLTLLSAEADDRYLIVEIGTNAPGEVAALASIADPEIAVITSIGEAHLAGLSDLATVASEKASLLDAVRRNGLAVVNIDSPSIRPHLGRCAQARLVTIGQDLTARIRVSDVEGGIHWTRALIDGRYRLELPIPGLHHATNAAAALAVARWFAISGEEVFERLRNFLPPGGRTNVTTVNGATFIDDTYNANPASVLTAVETLSGWKEGRRVLVLGDMWELGAHAERLHRDMLKAAIHGRIEIVLAVGPLFTAATRSLEPSISSSVTTLYACDDVSSATDRLRSIIAEGDAIWCKASRAVGLDRLVAHWTSPPEQRAAVA